MRLPRFSRFSRAFAVALVVALFAAACSDDGSPVASGATYCEIAARESARGDAFDPAAASPEEMQAFFDATLTGIDEGLAVAPEEIRADLETTRSSLVEMRDALAAANWDFAAAIDGVMAATSNPEADAASTRLDDYDQEVCGIEPTTTDPELDFSQNPDLLDGLLNSDTFREQVMPEMLAGGLTEEQANCVLDSLDSDMLNAMAAGEGDFGAIFDELFGLYQDCGVSLDQLGG